MKKNRWQAAAAMAAMMLLVGCAGPSAAGDSSSLSVSSEAVLQSEARASSLSGAESSAEEKEPGLPGAEWYAYWEAACAETRTLPEGPYERLKEEDDTRLEGAWLHYLDPKEPHFPAFVTDEVKYLWVLSVRVDPNEKEIRVSFGKDGTDAGSFYRGEYTFLEDGLLQATVEDVKQTEITGNLLLAVEWPPGGTGMAVFTINQIESDKEGLFASFIDVPLAYKHLDY